MASFKLYGFPSFYRAQKTLVCAQYTGVEIEEAEFKFPDDLKSSEFAELSPTGKVPVLVTPDGPLFESNAILRFVARQAPNTNICGKSFYENGLVEQWLDFCQNEVEPVRNLWLYPILGFMPFDGKSTNSAKGEVRKALDILNRHLLSRTFMVGNAVTLADIAIGSALVMLYQRVLDPNFRSAFVNVNRWFDLLIHQPEFIAVFGDVKLCEKMEAATPPKKEKKAKGKGKGKGGGGGGGGGGKGKGKGKGKGDEPPPPKKEPKKKNPLDLLPPPKMDMDSIKRLFSNNPFPEAIADFYTAERGTNDYSYYTIRYNYDSDNTVDFQTSNLVTGYSQRLESLRKYGFGALNIWGTEGSKGPFRINGAFVFRGTGVPFEFSDCPDSEYYTVAAVDLENDEERSVFEALLGGDKPFEGEPLYDRKYFK